MAKHLIIIKSNAVVGREADFEAWYNDTHLGEILQVEGFLSGQQFRHPPAEDGGRAAFSHFALFEVESDDPAASLALLGETFASGAMTPSDALDPDGLVESAVYEPTGAWQSRG
jgi:hypothetical protein